MTERIVIGEANEVRRHLQSSDGEILFDSVRPLGQLLLDFENDSERKWNVNAMQLHESYGKIFPFESKCWEIASPAASFLQNKYNSGEPSAMFAAVRTWDEYLNCYNLNHGAQLFLDRVSLLYRPFFLYGDYRPWQGEAAASLSQALHDGESAVELWYPVAKRPFECVVAYSSFQPIIFYYLHKIEEWKFVFQECKVCGKYFLARSRHFELCSDDCRKVQAVEAKKEFDERTKGDRLEQIHESAYYYWYNRQRKLKRAKTQNPQKIAAVAEAFKVFRKEAVRQKGMVKGGKIKQAEFSSWLNSQCSIIDKLMDE